MKSLYILPLQKSSGATLISVYFMEILKTHYQKVAYFCPIISNQNELAFIKRNFHLNIGISDMSVYTKTEAINLISKDENALLENIITQYNILSKKYDFVLICGIALDELNLFSENINLNIAKNLAAPILALMNYVDDEEIDINYHNIINSHNIHLATIINRSPVPKKRDYPLFCIQEIAELGLLNITQLQEQLLAKSVTEANVFKTIKTITIATMGLDRFIANVGDDELIIVEGDRSDIIVSTLALVASKTSPNISAILLTGGMVPQHLKNLMDGFLDKIPILSVQENTHDTIHKIDTLTPDILYMDAHKLSLVLGRLSTFIDKTFFLKNLRTLQDTTVTPLMFRYQLFEKAKNDKKSVVLSELDDRILKAAEIVLSRDIVNIVFVGDPKEYAYRASLIGVDISKATFIDYKNMSQMQEEFSRKFYELRKDKDITLHDAKELMRSNTTYFSTMLVDGGYADAMVCGATHTTAETVRPALQIIKTDKQTPLVSSVFFMALDTQVLVFGDCAINRDPSADALATIAISANDTAQRFGIEPRVAMLSYSTGNSGHGSDVEKVEKAIHAVRTRRADILIDGPMQYDSAVDTYVAQKKLPNSKIAGKATVLIFPDLNTGNTAYKAVQRSAKALAIGPILQGLRKPVNDLSRGCSIDDIVNTIAITAIQAQETL